MISTKMPEDFIKGIKDAFENGHHLTARQLAFEGVEHYPEHELLLKYAYILAPAMIIEGNPSPEDRKLYREWLKHNHFKYRNRWVAIRKGEFVGDALREEELKEQLGDLDKVIMISIG